MTKYIVSFRNNDAVSEFVKITASDMIGYRRFDDKKTMEEFIENSIDFKDIRVYKIEKEYKLQRDNVVLKEVK